MEVVDRFWSKVDKTGGCWEWQAGKVGGYGSFKVNGRRIYAHRFAWQTQNGPIPQGLLVMHKCDNPSCVNPDHLSVGTQKMNMEDREAKKRGADHRGEKNGRAKVSVTDIPAIRTSNDSLRKLASRYGVTTTAIRYIRIGKNWSHI